MAQVIIEKKDGIAILKIKGAFTGSVEELYEPIEHYLGECKNNKITPKIIIDLEKVPFMNATGLGALIGLRTRTKKLEGSITLVNPSEKVNRLFTITKLGSVFTITSMEEALKNN